MTIPNFFDPISYGPNPSLGLWLLSQVDGFFCLEEDRYEVVPEKVRGNSLGVHRIPVESPLYLQVLKIIAFCTVILPAIFVVAKGILRSMYTFYIIEESKISAKIPPINTTPQTSTNITCSTQSSSGSEKPKCCCKKKENL